MLITVPVDAAEAEVAAASAMASDGLAREVCVRMHRFEIDHTWWIQSVLVMLPGTRAWLGGQLLASSGCPSLDAQLGGGIPLGSVVIVQEDATACLSDAMAALFVGQAWPSGQRATVFADRPSRRRHFLARLPSAPEKSARSTDEPAPSASLERAWQYRQYATPSSSSPSSVTTTTTSSSSFVPAAATASATSGTGTAASGRSAVFGSGQLDLDHPLSAEQVRAVLCDPSDGDEAAVALDHIVDCVRRHSCGSGAAHRVVILGVGSPLWPVSARDLLRWLPALRAAVRSVPAIVLVTLPAEQALPSSVGSAAVERALRYADVVLRVSALGEERGRGRAAASPADLDGFAGTITLPRLPMSGAALVPRLPPSGCRGFAVRRDRRRLTVEPMHPPPEGGAAASAPSKPTTTTTTTAAIPLDPHLASSMF